MACAVPGFGGGPLWHDRRAALIHRRERRRRRGAWRSWARRTLKLGRGVHAGSCAGAHAPAGRPWPRSIAERPRHRAGPRPIRGRPSDQVDGDRDHDNGRRHAAVTMKTPTLRGACAAAGWGRLRCCDNAVLPSARRAWQAPGAQDRCGQGSESHDGWAIGIAAFRDRERGTPKLTGPSVRRRITLPEVTAADKAFPPKKLCRETRNCVGADHSLAIRTVTITRR